MNKWGTLGKYHLIQRIAIGGMSEIFLASQGGLTGFERAVIVKCIREDLIEEIDVVRMFLDEARIAACLKHSNIVHLYDVGEDRGIPYLAMEYIFGRDLMQISERARSLGEPIPIQFVLKSMCDALAGLYYAHEVAEFEDRPLQVVHRDVSPQNILVSFDGTSKLVDFGIAKAEACLSKTRAGVLKGKYAYMSPEQVRGKELDQRSDQFSLAVVYYEVLTGTRLFQRDTDYSTMEAVDRCEVPPIQILREDIPRRMDRVLRKAMRANPKRRYESCREMERLLSRLIRGSSVEQADFSAHYMRRLFADDLEARDLAIQAATGSRREVLLSTGFEMLEDHKDTFVQSAGEPPLAAHAYQEALFRRQTAETRVGTRQTDPGNSSPDSQPGLADLSETRDKDDTSVRRRPLSLLLRDYRFLALIGAALVLVLLFLLTIIGGPDEVELKPGGSKKPEAETRTYRPGKDGFLSVSVDPKVEVLVDGKSVGLGAFVKRPFPEGTHRITFKHTETGKTESKRVFITADLEQIEEGPDGFW